MLEFLFCLRLYQQTVSHIDSSSLSYHSRLLHYAYINHSDMQVIITFSRLPTHSMMHSFCSTMLLSTSLRCCAILSYTQPVRAHRIQADRTCCTRTHTIRPPPLFNHRVMLCTDTLRSVLLRQCIGRAVDKNGPLPRTDMPALMKESCEHAQNSTVPGFTRTVANKSVPV